MTKKALVFEYMVIGMQKIDYSHFETVARILDVLFGTQYEPGGFKSDFFKPFVRVGSDDIPFVACERLAAPWALDWQFEYNWIQQWIYEAVRNRIPVRNRLRYMEDFRAQWIAHVWAVKNGLEECPEP